MTEKPKKELPEKHREILAATGTYAEIAKTLGIKIGTVKSRRHRAKKLQQEIEEQDA